MAETLGTRQTEMSQTLNQRLDGMSQRLGETLTEQTRSTHENLSRLQERLAVIDAAQGNIQDTARTSSGFRPSFPTSKRAAPSDRPAWRR